MIKILICDNQYESSSNLESMILLCCNRDNTRYSLKKINSANSIGYEYSQGNSFNLIFIRVEMNKNGGVRIAEYVRNKIMDHKVNIVFYAKDDNMALKLFKLRPYDFLIEPIDENEVRHIVSSINKKIVEKLKFFYYKINKVYSKEKVENILYFKSDNRKVTMHKANGNITFYSTLNEVVNRTDGYFFWRIHRSIIVNSIHISIIRNNKVVLSNGEQLPIGGKHRIRTFYSWNQLHDNTKKIVL